MKTISIENYGPPEVLEIKETEIPVPSDKEVLIKVHATTVNYGDLTARNFKNISPREFNMPFLFWFIGRLSFGTGKPKIKILGNEFAGIVEDTGKDVRRFRKGDAVFGYLGQKMGAYAEFFCMPEDGVLAPKPSTMSYEEAAVIPSGAIMAVHLLREKGNIQPGHRVLINGASGGIGSAAVQIAKNHFGAAVTGVCGTARVDYVKSLGADKVIDYTKEDFTQSNDKYDLIFDVLGKSSFSKCKNLLTENGRYLLASFKMKKLLQMIWTGLFGSKKVICAIAPGSKDDLNAVGELIEAGKIKSIIDKRFPAEKAAEAHRYVEEGNKKGSVVIAMNKDKNQMKKF